MNDMRASMARRGWVQSHGATLVEAFRLVDAAWIFLGLSVARHWADDIWRDDDFVSAMVALALYTIAAGHWPLYRSWRVATLAAELRRNALCWLAAASALTALAFLLASQAKLPREVLMAWVPATLVMMLFSRVSLRLILRQLRKEGANYRLAAIAGANETGMSIVNRVTSSAWMGIKLVGIFDDRRPDAERVSVEAKIAGSIDELVRRATAGELDIVFIAMPLRAELRIRKLIDALRDSTVTVMYVPNFDTFGLLSASWEIFRGVPMVRVIDTPHHGTSAVSKRMFDILGAGALLILLAVPMLAIGLAVRLTSPGPALFRQRRYGLDGHEILIYKFRTMSVTEDGESQFRQARKGDPRVTKLGAFLRRTSLDELPQLINVLQGRMSIVGPRPHPIALNESHRRQIDGYMLRHKVLPGITGWAQVNGCRGETSTPDKMANRIRYDLEYINNWSLALDLRILWMTLFSVIDDPNAY